MKVSKGLMGLFVLGASVSFPVSLAAQSVPPVGPGGCVMYCNSGSSYRSYGHGYYGYSYSGGVSGGPDLFDIVGEILASPFKLIEEIGNALAEAQRAAQEARAAQERERLEKEARMAAALGRLEQLLAAGQQMTRQLELDEARREALKAAEAGQAVKDLERRLKEASEGLDRLTAERERDLERRHADVLARMRIPGLSSVTQQQAFQEAVAAAEHGGRAAETPNDIVRWIEAQQVFDTPGEKGTAESNQQGRSGDITEPTPLIQDPELRKLQGEMKALETRFNELARTLEHLGRQNASGEKDKAQADPVVAKTRDEIREVEREMKKKEVKILNFAVELALPKEGSEQPGKSD